METILFDSVVGMDAYRAKSVIRMKLASLGYYDVDFTETPYKKTQHHITPWSAPNQCLLLIDEKFDEVTVVPRFRGHKRHDDLW